MADGIGDFSAADAPPMTNGELVFEAPWQGRVFGIARALAEAGVFQWDEFRACLIEELATYDPAADTPFDYYQHFLRALERLLAGRDLVPPRLLGERFAVFMARPAGHDHDHDHGHDHGAGHG